MGSVGQNLGALGIGSLLTAAGAAMLWTLVCAAWRQRSDERRRRSEDQTAFRMRIAQAEARRPTAPTSEGWQGYRRFLVSDLAARPTTLSQSL